MFKNPPRQVGVLPRQMSNQERISLRFRGGQQIAKAADGRTYLRPEMLTLNGKMEISLNGKLMMRRDRKGPLRDERRIFGPSLIAEYGGVEDDVFADWEESEPFNLDIIPGWYDFKDIYMRAVMFARPNAKFVEVGGYCGRSSCHLASLIKNSNKTITLDVIDSFSDIAYASSRKTFEHFARLAGVDDIINLKTMDQLTAAASYEPRSLDFVFLDADHSYEGTKAAICAFMPKMKPGGSLGGHDMTPRFPGVIKAVTELLPGARIIGNSFLFSVTEEVLDQWPA
jgi:hypothetical protein